MRKYKTLMSFSFRDYGTYLSVFDDDNPVPLFIGCNNMDKAEGCRVLTAYFLEMAHTYDHTKDFCAPEFDKEQQEKQLEKLRELMTPIFEKE